LSVSTWDLLNSGLNVQDIALDYGFSYEQGYILSFRREFGFTPGDLRRNRQLVKTAPPPQPCDMKPVYQNNFLAGNGINERYAASEAVRDNLSAADAAGDWKKCLRTDAPWYSALGEDYVETAFRAAREAAPDITLYYNDYGLEDPCKAEAVYKMIIDINSRYKKETGQGRNLIEGLSLQSHYQIKSFDENKVRSSLEKFTALNIELSISGLDVTAAGYEEGGGKDIVISEHDIASQEIIYAKLFRIYLEYSPYISRVTIWGIDGGNSRLSAGNPCLFDRYLKPKRAFNIIFNTELKNTLYRKSNHN
jgi:endo-1,4-beta-xylanase